MYNNTLFIPHFYEIDLFNTRDTKFLGCFGYCCAPCMICANAKALGKMPDDKPPVYCLLACCLPVLGIFFLRQTARENYGIEVMVKLSKCGCVNKTPVMLLS